MSDTIPTWEETVSESEAMVGATTAPINDLIRTLTLGSIASAEGRALQQQREARKAALRNAFEQEQLALQEAEAKRLRYSPRTREGFIPTAEELQGASAIAGTELTQAGKDVRRSLEAGSLLAAGLYKPRGTFADVAKQLSVPRGATPEQLAEYPYQQGLAQLPESLQIAAEVPGGIAEVAPRIAGVAGMQAMGFPAPIAGGLMFGLTEEGFNPQEAAVGAAIPYVGKYAGQLTRALSKELGITNKASQNLLAAIAHGGGATAYLGTITASEIAGMAPEDRLEAVKQALPGSIGMLLMTVPGMKAELERGTPQQLAKLLDQAALRAGYRPRVPIRKLGSRLQPMDQPFADPAIQSLADEALRQRMSGLVIPPKASALENLRVQLEQQVKPAPGGRTLAERVRAPGETLAQPTAEGIRVEPGFERSASDLLLERAKPEPMKPAEPSPAEPVAPRSRQEHGRELDRLQQEYEKALGEMADASRGVPPKEAPLVTQAGRVAQPEMAAKRLAYDAAAEKVRRAKAALDDFNRRYPGEWSKTLPEGTVFEPMNQAERQTLQNFVDEEAKAGGVIPQKVLPKGVSYRKPTTAPTPAEYQRRVERDNVEAGLTIQEAEQAPEAPAAEGKQPEVTSVITATGRTLTKPGVLSALQRSRLRNALANGASEEVLVNIMRMSDRDIARRNPPTTTEEFRAAMRQTEKAGKPKAKPAAEKDTGDYERYQAARGQLRDMRERLGTAAFRSPEYMAIVSEMERIKNRHGGMPPTKPSPVVEGKAEPKPVPPAAPSGEAQAKPGAVTAAPVGQAISEPTAGVEKAQAPIAGAAPEATSRTIVPQGITATAAMVRRQALEQFPHLRGLVENGEIVFTDGKELWPENVRKDSRSESFEAVYLTNTKQVVFDARMFTGANAEKLGEIVVHEVAIHKGLRAALGDEVFNRTTIDIWNNLSEQEKVKILRKTGTPFMPVSEQMRQIVGEEWLAYEAQRVARSGVTSTVWTKIADGFRKALRAIGFKRSLSDTEIAMLISKGWEGVKAKEQAKGLDIPESAKENAVSVSNEETPPVAVNTLDGVGTARFSVRTWQETDQKKLIDDLVSSGIADQRTATKWMRDISNVAAVILRNREQLDYDASTEFASIKKNADAYYTLSEDYSTICRKGAKLLATVAQIMVREGGITSEQMWKVRSLLREKGEEVTCAACYVWSRKINIGPQLDKIAAKYPEIPHEILYDPQKSDILKSEYPKAWKMLMKAGSGIGKAFEVRSEYNRDIINHKQITPEFVKRQNMFSGLRSQSWSDFEIQHLIDKMQSAADKAIVGLMGHSYTKVPQYVELVAATGEMTNMSLIPLGTGLDAKGRLVFDDVEGMPFADAMRLRNLHDKTAGTVIIGATDAHIIACMKDGRIDYIIPYHKSGLNITLRQAGELAGWKDYEKEQKEGVADSAKFADYMAWKKSKGFASNQSEVRPWEYWDKNADGNTNAQNYLKYCEFNGIAPKFQRFAGMDGYWKLLVDRRMYDGQGKYIEQQVIKPNFDMKVVGKLVNSYLRGEWRGRGDDTPDMDVVSEVLKGREMQRAQQAQIVSEFRKAEGPGEVIGAEPGFRAATREQDREYLDAVARGDTQKAQSLVDEAAKRAGYIIGPVHHGTSSPTEFTVFKQPAGYSTEGFWFTELPEHAERYSREPRMTMGRKRVISSFLNIKNPFVVPEGRYAEEFEGTDVVPELKSQGYDGIVTESQVRNKEGNLVKTKLWMAFYPEQIKSVEPVTRDNSGKVIPLSERFQSTSPDFRAAKTLADARKIFEEKPKGKQWFRPIGKTRTGIFTEFHPLDEVAKMIADSYGYTSPKQIAGIFEQLKGSKGRGEAEVYRFDRDVGKLVKGNETNFSVYMFAQRTLDRLAQDIREGVTRRKVSDWTIADANSVLRQLEAEVGFDTFNKFKQAATKYQQYMDRALLLQVESGRMSRSQYNAIKAGNQFYAPFKVMKHIELQDRPEGTGKKVDTMADYTKAMEGIEDPDLRLGDMMAAGKQALLTSRILADKAAAMKHIADLAVLDSRGLFIRKMFKGQNPRDGYESVNVYENGKVYKYEVPNFVAQAIQTLGPASNGVYVKWLSRIAVPFKAGATAFNVPFQISNLVADVPRAALVSKYGVRAVSDAYMYPLEFIESIFSSIGANVFGIRSKSYYDFLESGAAGSSVQEFLTSKSLLGKKSLGQKVFANTLGKIGDFAQAIEQTSKILGVKRAIRFEKVRSGAELAKLVPEAITEIRRFSGSPDFGRQGAWVQQARLNLLYMFLNARVQGAAADIGRLVGADGAKTAAITWTRLITAVGVPTLLLYLLNDSSDELREGYKQRSDFEKRNYWLIPKDTFITTEDGERIRDYWRIPKRESSKWVANLIESAMDFAKKDDPEAFKEFTVTMLEDITPVNIEGDTFQERLESVGASLNPVLKAPIEMATGRDMYRHQQLIPEIMRGAKTPELQFKDRTPELFKWGAERMPDIMPSVLRSPIMLENLTRNLTAGLLTQWLPKKPIEGRGPIENSPLLQRFQAMPYIDNEQKQKLVDELKGEAVDNYLIRHRKAQKYLEDNKGADLETIVGKAYETGDLQDVKLANHLVDLFIAKQNGVNAVERRLIALPAEQRAKYVLKALSEVTGEEREKLYTDWVRKRVLTEATLMEMMKADPEGTMLPIGPGIQKEKTPLVVPDYEDTEPIRK